MKTRRQIPNTELFVSPICLGTANFIEDIPVEDGYKIMDAFYEAGGNFINTAHEYLSEPVIAKWMQMNGIKRDDVVIVTKGGEDHTVPGRDCHAMHYDDLIEDCDESLERLGTDHLDVFELHIDDEPHVPVSEVMDAMETLVKTGRTRYVGVSNWLIHRIREAKQYCDSHPGKPFFVMNEIEWSLAHLNTKNGDSNCTWLDKPFEEFQREIGLTVTAYSPQASGIFTRYQRAGLDGLNDWQKYQYGNKYNSKMYKNILRLSEQTGMTIPEICISYVATQNHGFMSFPIVGARNVDQLMQSLKCLKNPITDEMKAILLEGVDEYE